MSSFRFFLFYSRYFVEGNSVFNHLMEFIAKRCRIIFSILFKNKFLIGKAISCKFAFVNTEIYSMCTQWPQNFAHVYKKGEFCADFNYIEIIRTKCTGKSYLPNCGQIFNFTLFLVRNFYDGNVLHFLNSFGIPHCLHT